MERQQPHFSCLFCGQRGHLLATCQRRLSILNNSKLRQNFNVRSAFKGTPITNASGPIKSGIFKSKTFSGTTTPYTQIWLRQTSSTVPAPRKDYHAFGIRPSETTQHFRSKPLLAPGVLLEGDTFIGLNPLYKTRRTEQYWALLQDFESTNHTYRKILNCHQYIRGICLYPVMDLMRCGALNLEDHVCDGHPRPIVHRMRKTPCLNPAYGVKCLAGSRIYGLGTAKTYHTCAQFAPTDPNHPWNFGRPVCSKCQIPHLLDVPCKVALDFGAPTYEQWKSINLHRRQALPLYASPRQRRHAKTFSGLQIHETSRNNTGFIRNFGSKQGLKTTASLPVSPPQRPLPPTPQEQKIPESLPRLQAIPHEEENCYEEIADIDNKGTSEGQESVIGQKEDMTFSSPLKKPITTKTKDDQTVNPSRILDFGSEDFQKFLWKPEADYVHQPLQDLRPFVSVRVPLLYRFAPTADKWLRYQPETALKQRNQWQGTALWYMPTAWITQCPKEVTPNAIFGMCPKSLCSGTTCQVYRFKGHLYCDHGFTDNEDAHKGLNFLFTSHLPKDSKKVEERIINFFPVTAMKPCYRIQDSAKIYCPKAV